MILSRMSRTYLVFTIIPKTIRTFNVQMMVLILFHIMDIVAGGCHLNLTAEALWSTFANSPTGPTDGKPGEVWCPPGYVHYDDRTACSSVKEQATMPYWNSCRNAFSCEDWRCGENEEEIAPCNKTHFPVCRSRVLTPTTSSSGTTFSEATVTASATPEIIPVSCAYEVLYSILGSVSVAALIEFFIIIIGFLLCQKNHRRIYNNDFPEKICLPSGRKNDAAKYTLRGNPAGTAILIVNPDREDIGPDIELSNDIFKQLLGSKTIYKCIEATSVNAVEAKIQDLLASGDLGDSLVCIVLGHGTLDKPIDGLICQERKQVLHVDLLTRWFHGTNCPQFLGKPKLFFYTCCRGDASEEVRYVQESGGGGSGPTAVSETADILISFASSHGTIVDVDEEQKVHVLRKGKASYFDEHGSVYLLTLKEALTKGIHKDDDIYSILTEVSRKISSCSDLRDKRSGKQVHQQPAFHSTLTQKFYPVGDNDDEEEEDVQTDPRTSTHPTRNGNAVAYRPVDTDNDSHDVTLGENHELDVHVVVGGGSDDGNDDTQERSEEGERNNVNNDDVHTVLIHDGASNSNTEPSQS